MSKLDALLSRLDKVKRTGVDSYIACCPAHQDKSPSMTIREVEPDHLLVYCFAGCEAEAILGAIGLTFTDVHPDRAMDEVRKPSRIPFNSRDVLAAMQSDAGILFLTLCDLRKGKVLSIDEIDNAYKSACRIYAGAKMGGVQ